jgi:fermentation-respiration switch protein FrsA (DUF1100 family)
VSLAGITDLRRFSIGSAYCNASVAPLLGGTVDAVPERYSQTSPVELLPLRVPVRLLRGSRDTIVAADQSTQFATRARSRGDAVEVLSIEGAGHFDLIAPFAPAWVDVERAVVSLISGR